MTPHESERGLLQQRLSEQEANLRLAQHLLDIGIWKMELATGRVIWCEHAHRVYGVSRDVLGNSFDAYVELVHPQDRDRFVACFQDFHSADAALFQFSHRIIRPDGEILHVRGVAEREDRGGTDWLTGVIQDVTAEADARERVAEANRIQRIAERTARLGGWRVDLDPIRIKWSPETCAIHGEPEGSAPEFDKAITYYLPEHRDRIRAAFASCAESGQSFDEVAQLLTAMGGRVWVRTIGEAVRDEDGAIIALQGAFQDISELVATRDQSDALARRLRQTLESISDAFYLLDHDWRFSFLNGKAEMLGHRNRGDLVGKVFWEEFPETVGSDFQREYEMAVRTGRAVRFQAFYPPLDTWFEVDAYPTPEGLAVYFRDVTQQRTREEHLRLLDAAVARQNDLLLITEAEPINAPDGPRIVYVNDAFVKRTGFSREEALGNTPRILQGPQTQRAELDRIRTAMEAWQPVRAELINYTKAGDPFWLEIDIVPLADESGWFTHWVSIERDITERKRNESALQQSEERFRLVAKATNDVVSDWDMVTGTFWWNEHLHCHFGYDPALVAPGPGSWIDPIHAADKDRVLQSMHAALDGVANIWTEEYRFLHADGHPMTIVDRAFIIRDAEGKAIRMLGSMVDVTGEREMESRLRQSQKLEVVGQLTGGVAHDFNNLLTVILGNAEMLAEKLADHAPLRALAEMTVAAAERGADLTSRLLAFSRKQQLKPELMDVGRLIHRTESLLRRTLTETIDIRIIRAQGLWSTEVDASQLEAALLNLVLNARDAMPDGGCVTIETRNEAVAAADDEEITPSEYVMIGVTDTGEGIPADIRAQIFEPFFTTKEVGKGSGLGLSMVYGFVKQSGGHIDVTSEPAAGTSIRLYFPRAHGVNRVEKKATNGHLSAGGSETILVVEDDKLVRDHLISRLKALGYTVIEASSGPAAIEILQNDTKIALLFTDVVMPGGMNGGELATKAKAIRSGLKILFTTGYTQDAILQNGRLHTDVALLSKPYRHDRLASKVREVLDSR